jgi:phytoene dehydrogenase-like protein
MADTVDFVVAGGGHNSLITAAYLAKAGYSVTVIDARSEAGGGAATEEVLLPGFHFDTCSTGHTLIQTNPVLANDELGIYSEYGLTYIDPDPVAHVVFPDGEHFTLFLDLDQTIDEISRFSPKDAATYLRMLDEFESIKSVYGNWRFTPVGYGPSLDEALATAPNGRIWMRRNVMSAWDIIGNVFESRHIQAFMTWMAFQTAQPIDSPGSAYLAYSLVGGRQRRSWSIPVGGSASLPRAIVASLEAHGGTVVTNTMVTGLVVESGRCIGVETASGDVHRARLGVVSSIHVKSLVEMAPSEAWGDEFLYGVDTYDEGISSFASYYATTEEPRYLAGKETRSAVSAGWAAWPEDVIEFAKGVRRGRIHTPGTFLLFATPTIVDPSRAPEGRHTVKILSMAPYEPPPGATDWESFKDTLAAEHLAVLQSCAPNLTDETILARKAKSPLDIEASNPHMWHGTIHGGDRGLANSWAQRPAPGWAQHRMPIPGLYQTGATTHPGGSITGGPGRNAAVVILDDLGRTIAEVVAG